MNKGAVIWFTGPPGSGKTTLVRTLQKKLLKNSILVEILDGDEVRKWLSPEEGYSRKDRERHLRRVAHVARLLARNGIIVLAAFVSPYRKIRREIRKIIENDELEFMEIFVKCSMDTCIKRDPKGIYKKALQGKVEFMTGIQDSYEKPLHPDIILDTEQGTPEECVKQMITRIESLSSKIKTTRATI